MHHKDSKGGTYHLRKRPTLILLTGILLGVCLSFGSVYAIRQYSPDWWAQTMLYLAAKDLTSTDTEGNTVGGLDMDFVKGLVQDVLTSEQGKAIVSDLVRSQSQKTFEAFFSEAMKNPDFRLALSDALGDFLQSAEGKALVRKVAQEAMNP
jgi:hypothetical protein